VEWDSMVSSAGLEDLVVRLVRLVRFGGMCECGCALWLTVLKVTALAVTALVVLMVRAVFMVRAVEIGVGWVSNRRQS